MTPAWCAVCRCPAMVEPNALGWEVKCESRPWAHTVGPYKGRDRAVQAWNEVQREVLKNAEKKADPGEEA